MLEIDAADAGHIKGPGRVLHHRETGAAACLLEPPRPAEKEENPSSDTRSGIRHCVFKFPVKFIASGRRESLVHTGQYEDVYGVRASHRWSPHSWTN